jgi:beta-glucosidase
VRTKTYAPRMAALALMLLLPALATAGAAGAQEPFPFRNPDLPVDQRVDDLLGRLTLEEKIAMLHQYQPAIPRLGIERNKNGTEALHGLAWTNDYRTGDVVTATATVFPQAIGLASTWDPRLVERVGDAVGIEARGYHSAEPAIWGLNLWAPVADPLRDPRWGRNEEGYSEDPYLAGTMATAYTAGLRGDDPAYLLTAPTLKHYVGYNNEVRRDVTSSNLRPRVRHEYSDVPFRMPIEANTATGVMASYNLVNGRPMTVSPDADDVVRSWTDETLMNVTDAFAPNNLTGSQAYYDTLAEADAAVLRAGLDSFTTDGNNPQATIDAITAGLDQGLITEADIDDAVRHVLTIRFRLGEFDPGGGPYAGITMADVDTPEHRALAREAATDAMVLLRNEGSTLPLDPDTTDSVAVVGPLVDTLYTDWYSGALPYQVTPRQGIAERLGADATVTGSEAVDRIALRAPDGRYVTAPTGEAGGPLTATAATVGDTEAIDVFDWGEGTLTLRTVANGRYASFGPDRTMVNNASQPNGWFVQQQFKLVEQADGTFVVEYAGNEVDDSWFGDQKYVVVGADGTLTISASSPAEATRFTRDVISDGSDEAVAAATGADAAVVVVGSMPFINGREDDDRTTMALAPGQADLVRAVQAANPNTVVVVENSYPTTDWADVDVPSILWTTHAGAETGHALADVLFGDTNPAGRLTQTWYRSESDLPSILDYDIIQQEGTYQYFTGEPLYPIGHGLSYTSFEYDNLRLGSRTVDKGGRLRVSVDVTNTGDRAGDEVVQLYVHQQTSRDEVPLRQLEAFERVHLRPGETRTVRLSVDAADLAHWDVTRNRWVVESSAYDVMVGASSTDIRESTSVRVRGDRIPARDLSHRTRAIDFDDYQGVELVDESRVRGDAVAGEAGDWLAYRDVDLGRGGAGTFTARVARASAGEGSIEIRLGSLTGRLVGTATVPSTGDPYAYTTTTADLSGTRGRHDVYLVFTTDLRISRFTIR